METATCQRCVELLARIAQLEAMVAKQAAVIEAQAAQIAELTERLNRDSSNSSKPPSSDGPGKKAKRSPPTPKSGRSRGGQPGHAKHERPLAPPEEVKEFVECRPTTCRDCGAPLEGDDPTPRRHQVIDIPPVVVDIVEYRLHALHCRCCGAATVGVLPEGVPNGCLGPRVTAIISLLSGAYRLAKRPIGQLLSDLCGLSISLGMICKSQRQTSRLLQPIYQDLRQFVQTQPVHIDETSWRGPSAAAVDMDAAVQADAQEAEQAQKAGVLHDAAADKPTGKRKPRSWLWFVVAPRATVFHIAATRSRAVVRELLGECVAHVVTCDRWTAYRHLPIVQWCWAHLRRDFQAMIDRGNQGEALGESLLAHSNAMFRWWHRVRDGTMTRATFRNYMTALKAEFRNDLLRGAECGCTKTSATCCDLLDHWAWLWTFVSREGVEPTNNAAERAGRHAVLWRKCSGGTDSQGGSGFVERILSVVASCRQQGRHVLEFLTQCHQNALLGIANPNLLPSPSTVSTPLAA